MSDLPIRHDRGWLCTCLGDHHLTPAGRFQMILGTVETCKSPYCRDAVQRRRRSIAEVRYATYLQRYWPTAPRPPA